MKQGFKISCGIAVLVLILFAGCTKRYVITTDLTSPIELSSACVIGAISDDLPEETKEEDKPSMEDIDKLKMYLLEEIDKKGILSVGFDHHNPLYSITGSIFEFKKGSGALRFFIGFGAGSAKMVMNLKLTDLNSNEVLFAGNFSHTISSWGESGDKVYKQIAKDFAKELEKQHKKF